MHPNRVRVIVLACVVLHNMLRAERGVGSAGDLEDEEIPCDLEDGDLPGGHDRNPTNSAKEQRDCFNGACAVPWQDGKV